MVRGGGGGGDRGRSRATGWGVGLGGLKERAGGGGCNKNCEPIRPLSV